MKDVNEILQKKITAWQFNKNNEIDITFLRDFVTPYFSEVYQCLVNGGRKSYLEPIRFKTYLNLPDLMAI